MNTLHAPACTLEPQVQAHAEEIFELLCDPAIHEFEGAPPPSLAQLAERFRRLETRVSADGRERFLNWVVRRHADGRLAGYVQATVHEDGAAGIGYEFGSRYWRQGLGTAAVSRMLEELHTACAVHTFVAVLKAGNFRSLALLRRLGFTPGSAAQARRFEAGPDEIILVMAAEPPRLPTEP